MVRAAIYLRISKDHSGEQLGVSRQLEDCRTHAQLLGWEVTEVYTDNDISATSGKTRPAYKTMLANAEAGEIDGIIAWHADRLYRKATDLGELVDVCKRNDTQIATVRAGTIDLTTPTGRLVAGLLANVATYEGEAKADRWKRAWRQGRENGSVATTGSRMFGYTPDMQVIPEEAAITRRMADDILGGMSLMDVTRWLDAEGIPATRGRAWRTATIKQYLTNPRIAGWSTLHREIIAEGQWEPLLDRETWEAVRAFLSGRTRAFVPRKSLLNGLAFCAECGSRLITGSARAGVRTYRCSPRPDIKGCGGVSATAAGVEEVVEVFAQTRLADPSVRERIDALRSQPQGGQRELAALELRIHELEQQLDEPGVPVATLLRAIERIKERQSELIDQVVAQPAAPLPHQGEWPEDLRRRRAFVDLVVQRVDIAPARKGANRFEPERVCITPRY